jgi:cytochrome c-type biogenesis protein CcmH/NrfG
MTAVRYNRPWIKFLIVLLLLVLGIAGIYYAYVSWETVPAPEKEHIEEEVIPEEERV